MQTFWTCFGVTLKHTHKHFLCLGVDSKCGSPGSCPPGLDLDPLRLCEWCRQTDKLEVKLKSREERPLLSPLFIHAPAHQPLTVPPQRHALHLPHVTKLFFFLVFLFLCYSCCFPIMCLAFCGPSLSLFAKAFYVSPVCSFLSKTSCDSL